MDHSIRIAAIAHKARYQVAYEAATHLRLKWSEKAKGKSEFLPPFAFSYIFG